MQTSPSAYSDRGRAGAGLAVAVFLAALLCLALPRSAAGVLPLVALSVLAVFRPGVSGLRQALIGSPAAKALLLFLLYALINCLWSLDRGEAFAKAGLAAAYGLLVLAALPCLLRAGSADSRRLVWALALGGLVGALFLAFEVWGAQPAATLFHDLVNPERREPDFEDLNRNAGMLSLLFWPLLLAMGSLGSARWRIGLGLCFLVAAIGGVGASSHETSMLALAASAVIFAAFKIWPAVTRWCVLGAWCGAFLLVVPAVMLAYKAELHMAEWLQQSARARVVLWNETARRIPEAPIFGIGVRSSRVLFDETGAQAVETPENFPYPLRPGRHAHNFFLQSWYELGLIGVFFFAGAGVAVLRTLRRLPERAQAFAHAQFTAFMAVAATAWGLWQSWLIAGIGLSVLAMGIALAPKPTEGSAAES